MREAQDEIVRKIARRKKARRRTRGPYRKSSKVGLETGVDPSLTGRG
jgi:hypothetical protein